MSADPWADDTAWTAFDRDRSLMHASIVIDALLDARLESRDPSRHERIDELLVPLSHRRLLTPDEASETMVALEGLETLGGRQPHRHSRRA